MFENNPDIWHSSIHCTAVIQMFAYTSGWNWSILTALKMEFSIKDFFSKCEQIHSYLIWSHLLKKSLMENLIFGAVSLHE